MNNITMKRVIFDFCAPILLILCTFGCYPAPRAPIDTLRYDAPVGDHKELFVFLPGNGDPLNVFDKNGLTRAVRERNLPIDMVAVNAHLGYYIEGTIFMRLQEDVIGPAKARGYKEIWLIGNSLGAYGSITYASRHPGDITGIVLLGPFLGDKKLIQEIRDAGGLQHWEPGDITDTTQEAWERRLWKWLKESSRQKCFRSPIRHGSGEDENCPPQIYMGYGKRDRFSYGDTLLAEYLPPENVFSIDGGHDWRTWKKLWDLILDRMSEKSPAPARLLPN
jgi:pimeloyl-ACP methyl ester carboxylesterase